MLQFGVPQRNKRNVLTEKYTTPVVTSSEFKGKGTSRSFEFNKAAIKAFGLENVVKEKGEDRTIPYIAFAFQDGKVFVANTTGLGTPGSLRLGTTNFRVSDRPTFEYILDLFGLSQEVENEFSLEDTGDSYEGQTLFQLKPITEDTKNNAVSTEQAIDDEVEDIFNNGTAAQDETVEDASGSLEDKEETTTEEVDPFFDNGFDA